jgi:cytochrome b561
MMALFGLLGGGAVATFGIMQLKRTQSGKTSLIVSIVIYIILAIISLFGFIGAAMKKRKFVSVYWAMSVVHLLLSFLAGIYTLHTVFQDAPANVSACINGSTAQTVLDTCKRGETTVKGVLIALYIIIWMLQIYGIIIIDNYCKQLVEEDEASFKTMDNEGGRPTW